MELTQKLLFEQFAEKGKPGEITENAYPEGPDESLFLPLNTKSWLLLSFLPSLDGIPRPSPEEALYRCIGKRLLLSWRENLHRGPFTARSPT